MQSVLCNGGRGWQTTSGGSETDGRTQRMQINGGAASHTVNKKSSNGRAQNRFSLPIKLPDSVVRVP